MRFAVVGAGMQGRACAFDLLQNQGTREVRLIDASSDVLEECEHYLRRFFIPPRTTTHRADARDASRVAELASGCDVLVSCVPYFLNLALARAAVARRIHFVDLGGNTDIVREELALHDAAVLAGVSVLPDLGLGPGMTIILATHGMSMLDEVDAVHIRDGGLPQKPRPPMNYLRTFSEHGLINEYVEDATALRDGKVVRVPGLSEVEEIDLGPPLGKCEAAHAAGGLSTLPYTYAGRVREMDCKLIRYPGHIAAMNAMNAMGFFREAPVDVGGTKVSPRALSAALLREHFAHPGDTDLVIIRIIVTGRKAGRPAEVVFRMLDVYDEAHEMTSMMRTTGFPTSIVAQMLARGGAIPAGAYPVETGVPTEAFVAEARARGFQIECELRWLD